MPPKHTHLKPFRKPPSITPPRSGRSNEPSPIWSPSPHASSGSGWAGGSSLASMRIPSEMTSQELGLACTAAARELVDSPKFWSLIAERAKSLAPTMEPRDIALLLNGMTRSRQLSRFPDLLSSLSDPIRQSLPYFSSVHLAMTVSALSKSFPPTELSALVKFDPVLKEAQNRLHEFATSVEFTMLLNAFVKLGTLIPPTLPQRIGAILGSKISSGSIQFQSRELCLVGSSLASLGYTDPHLFSLIERRVISSISETTLLELARLASGLARVGRDITPLLSATTHTHSHRMHFMNASDLVAAVYGFGSVSQFVSVGDSPELTAILSELKSCVLKLAPTLELDKSAALIQSFARWKIELTDDELEKVLPKEVSCESIEDCMHVLSISASLLGLVEMHAAVVKAWVGGMSSVISSGIRSSQANTISRLVQTLALCDEISDEILSSLSEWVILNFSKIDLSTKQALHDALSKRHSQHDLCLLLASP